MRGGRMQVGKGIRKFEEATDATRPLSKVRIVEDGRR